MKKFILFICLFAFGLAYAATDLNVRTFDATTSVNNVRRIKVRNGTLTNNGSGIIQLNYGTGNGTVTSVKVLGSNGIVANGTVTTSGTIPVQINRNAIPAPGQNSYVIFNDDPGTGGVLGANGAVFFNKFSRSLGVSNNATFNVSGTFTSKTFTLNGNTFTNMPVNQGALLTSNVNSAWALLNNGNNHTVLKTNGNRLAWEADSNSGGTVTRVSNGDQYSIISNQTTTPSVNILESFIFNGTIFTTNFATKTTTDLTEGTNLYYTIARVNGDIAQGFAERTTTNLAEGTNLYYTGARVNGDIADQRGVTIQAYSNNLDLLAFITSFNGYIDNFFSFITISKI